MQLTVTNNQSSNLQSLDLTNFIQVGDESMDPASPSFSNKVISHSLLKEGGVLALEDNKNKELVFPLLIGPFGTGSAMANYLSLLNQIITTAGGTAQWTDDGMSQATTFDLISSQFDVEYNYRRGQKFYTTGKLRLFSLPFGRTAGPRIYAAASGYGPLLMITPYTASGTLAIGASTQAGVAGFGGRQQGASSGIFYSGSPSLAGDAPALLQIAFAGPSQSAASRQIPISAVSLLPDKLYVPLLVAGGGNLNSAAPLVNVQSAVASSYWTWTGSTALMPPLQFDPLSGVQVAPAAWAGNHRVFAVARASGNPGVLVPLQIGSVYPGLAVASVTAGDWSLYDLGTFALKGSQAQQATIKIAASQPAPLSSIDVTALVMLPDAATWYFNPARSLTLGPTAIIDDFLSDQRSAGGSTAPDPTTAETSAGTSFVAYTRGLVPRPDPRNGLPILAVLAVRSYVGSPNPQNGLVTAQVNVIERTKYILP